jgi:hypothetical protein
MANLLHVPLGTVRIACRTHRTLDPTQSVRFAGAETTNYALKLETGRVAHRRPWLPRPLGPVGGAVKASGSDCIH